jgi:hypothetical protein
MWLERMPNEHSVGTPSVKARGIMHGSSTAERTHLLVGATDAPQPVQLAGRLGDFVLRLLRQRESGTHSETSSQRSTGCRLSKHALNSYHR